MKTLRQPLVLPPPSPKAFGQALARLLATARQHEPRRPWSHTRRSRGVSGAHRRRHRRGAEPPLQTHGHL